MKNITEFLVKKHIKKDNDLLIYQLHYKNGKYNNAKYIEYKDSLMHTYCEYDKLVKDITDILSSENNIDNELDNYVMHIEDNLDVHDAYDTDSSHIIMFGRKPQSLSNKSFFNSDMLSNVDNMKFYMKIKRIYKSDLQELYILT